MSSKASYKCYLLFLINITIHVISTDCARRTDDDHKDYFEKIGKLFEKGGATMVRMFLDREMTEWTTVDINIAIIGQSGSGKSSFINAILGVSADDKGSAEVGVVETTRTIKPYPHPGNPRTLLWDLPGAGTPNFLRDEYFNKIDIEQFDYLVLITSDRFREDDLWLARELQDRRKLFYFLRSKVGQDVLNNQKSHPRSHNESQIIDEIRRDCKENLADAGLKHEVFLVDSYDTTKYDFEVFSAKLINDAPFMKREALILSMTVYTESIIDAKIEVLSERIHKLAIMSSIAGAMPVPLLDTVVDVALLIEEAEFYRNQFGLETEMLGKYASNLQMKLEDLQKYLDLQSTLIRLSSNELLKYFTKKAAKAAVTLTTAKYMKYIFPVVGSTISAGAAYSVASWCLHDLLDVMSNDAKTVLNHTKTLRK